MKSDVYKINNAVEKIKTGKNTQFLGGRELKIVTGKLKKNEYNVYYPYKDSEKVMLYTGKVPKVKLFKIYTVENIRHQDILGSLFALNIDSSYFGDIVLYNDYYYVFVSEDLALYIKDNLKMVGNKKVSLEEVDLSVLDNYERNYEEKEIIVSSLRIDNVVSVIINTSRKVALDKIKNKEVVVNYDVMNKNSYILKENDIFSIRRYGKYKFVGIVKSTKKNNFIVRYLKYI
jgi:RNA-binding protein YlmH